jgi:hypothetical protein
MNIDESLKKIFPFACPSIQYRMRKEFLCQPPDLPEMAELQNRILEDDTVKAVIDSQQADGWLAWTFHGYQSMESGIRLLCEKGLEPTQPVLAAALLSLEKHTDRLTRGLGKVGKILDELGFGGSETIRACLFAHAGNEETSFVKEQAKQALEVFKLASQIKSLKDLCESYKGTLVYQSGVRWPGIYHLRLLAMTQNWRTPENRKLIEESVQHIVHLSPFPDIHVRHKSQLISPPSFCMDNFTPEMNALTDAEWM